MTTRELRKLVLQAMEEANVIGLPDEGAAQAFLSGVEDIPLSELEMDSLATMQVCIGLEQRTGVSIVPRDLKRMRSLEEVVRALAATTAC